jgi:hypothetical protein
MDPLASCYAICRGSLDVWLMFYRQLHSRWRLQSQCQFNSCRCSSSPRSRPTPTRVAAEMAAVGRCRGGSGQTIRRLDMDVLQKAAPPMFEAKSPNMDQLAAAFAVPCSRILMHHRFSIGSLITKHPCKIKMGGILCNGRDFIPHRWADKGKQVTGVRQSHIPQGRQ